MQPESTCSHPCSWPNMSLMKTIGYVRVSSDKQADRGVSLEAQAEKIRAMAVVHNAGLIDIIVDGGESAKSLNRPGMARLLALVDTGEVQAVIIAKLDRLTRSVKDLCTLLERLAPRWCRWRSCSTPGRPLGGWS
jgi:site-specific DNA recombinase